MANFDRNVTGQRAVTDVMKTIGLLPPSSIADTTDRTAQQFWTLATEVGQQLLDESNWQVLTQEFIITTTAGVLEYDLPADFGSFVNDANWNRTSSLPLMGALTKSEWQLIKARTVGSNTITMQYQIANNKVVFNTVPVSGQTLVFPYTSRGWVVDAAGTTLRDNLIFNDDVVLYDPQLFKVALKLAWETVKKFDTTATAAEYVRVLANAKAKDSPARTLSLDRRGNEGYLSIYNIPETNYGL